MIFDTYIKGIPCKCKIISYTPGVPACTSGPPEHWHDGEPEEMEYEVLDRKGYPALWLERKMTNEDVQNLEMDIYFMLRAEEYAAAEAAAQDRVDRENYMDAY